MHAFETVVVVLGGLLVLGAVVSGVAHRSLLSLTALFVVAGILHHVPDDVATEMLVEALSLVAEGGTLVISEPEAVRPGDGIVLRLFYKLEQGRFLRSREALEALVRRAGVNISRADDQLMRMSPGMPHVARFNLLAQLPA